MNRLIGRQVVKWLSGNMIRWLGGIVESQAFFPNNMRDRCHYQSIRLRRRYMRSGFASPMESLHPGYGLTKSFFC